MWDQSTGLGSWNVRFVRAFNDWEMNLVGNPLDALQEETSSELDKVMWKGSERECFSSVKVA